MSVHDDISNPLNQLVANPDEKKLRSEQAINLVLLSLQAPMCEFFFLVVDVINTVNFKRRLFHRHILINEMFELETHSSVAHHFRLSLISSDVWLGIKHSTCIKTSSCRKNALTTKSALKKVGIARTEECVNFTTHSLLNGLIRKNKSVCVKSLFICVSVSNVWPRSLQQSSYFRFYNKIGARHSDTN